MDNANEKKTIIIDGFEFPKIYPYGSDLENLNRFLKGKCHDFYIQDFLARRHPKLYPIQIGLRSREGYTLELVAWEHHTFYMGEYQPGWDCYGIKDSENYKNDILEYYQAHEPDFYNFIKDRLK